MSEDKITVTKIIKLLELKHPSPQWACFSELRNKRGYASYYEKIRAIDFFAFNLWKSSQHWRIAYEIKLTHSDFLNELKNPSKRKPFVDISNEFYFVAPVGIIPESEVPEECGLIEVTKSSLRVKRRAQQRQNTDIDLTFAACMIDRSVEKHSAEEIESLKLFKYAGREMTEKELYKLVDKECSTMDAKIRREVKREYEDKLTSNPIIKAVAKHMGGNPRYLSEDRVIKFLEETADKSKGFVKISEFKMEIGEIEKTLKWMKEKLVE